MKNKRHTGIELLKIFSMIGVIVLHYNNATIGKAFSYVPMHSAKAYALYFLECMFICAVDVFMLISGYFMIESKKIDFRKPIRLLIQVIVFREFTYFLQVVLNGAGLSLRTVLSTLLPASYFAVLYAAVYVFSPFINRLMLSLNKKALNAFMVMAVMLLSVWPYTVDVLEKFSKTTYAGLNTIGMYGSQSGYTLVNFMLMYLIGAYLKIADLRVRPSVCAAVLLGCWLILFAFANLLVSMGLSAGLAWEYCNPVVILSAAAVFLLFKYIRMKYNPVISSMAKATFSVYLLNSVLILLFADTQKAVLGSGYGMLLHIALVCAAICLISWAAQIVYDWAMAPVYRFIDQRLKVDMTFSIDDERSASACRRE